MASDKERTFGANAPRTLNRSGYKASELLAFAAGKKPGEAITGEDLSSALSKRGISAKDSRRIMDAFKRYSTSGLDYVLSPDGKSYNVFESGPDGKGLTKSSRTTGNVKGFDAGDLIGLGNKVSTLMGFAGMFANDYRKSLEKPTDGESGPPDVTGPLASGSSGSSGSSDIKSNNETDNSADKDRLMTPAEMEAFRQRMGAYADDIASRFSRKPDPDFDKKLDAFSRKYGSKSQTNQQSSTKQQSLTKPVSQTTKGEDLVNRLLTGIESTGLEYGLGTMADLASLMGRPDKEANLPLDEQGLFGYLYNQGKKTVQSRASQINPAYDLDVSSGLAEAGPGLAASLYGGTKVLQGVGAFGSGMGWQGPKYLQRARSFVASKLPNAPWWMASPATYARAAQRALSKRISPYVDDIISRWRKPPARPARGPGYDASGRPLEYEPGYGIPGQADYFPPGGFKRGGKMYLGPGGTTSVDELMRLGNPEAQNQYFLPDSFGEAATIADMATVNSVVAPEGDWLMDSRTPGIGGGGDDEGPNWMEAGAQVAKYALPFMGALMKSRALDSMPSIGYTPADFMTGTVVDIPRPNFGQAYRGPVGVDVQSEIAGQKFAAAYQRAMEADYEQRNALSRIEQRNAITDRTNQGIMFNKQGQLNADIYNAQLAAQKVMGKAGAWEDALTGTHHNIQSDVAQRAAIRGEQESAMAAEVLRNPDAYPDQYQHALKVFNRALGVKQKGGKLLWTKPHKVHV